MPTTCIRPLSTYSQLPVSPYSPLLFHLFSINLVSEILLDVPLPVEQDKHLAVRKLGLCSWH